MAPGSWWDILICSLYSTGHLPSIIEKANCMKNCQLLFELFVPNVFFFLYVAEQRWWPEKCAIVKFGQLYSCVFLYCIWVGSEKKRNASNLQQNVAVVLKLDLSHKEEEEGTKLTIALFLNHCVDFLSSFILSADSKIWDKS